MSNRDHHRQLRRRVLTPSIWLRHMVKKSVRENRRLKKQVSKERSKTMPQPNGRLSGYYWCKFHADDPWVVLFWDALTWNDVDFAGTYSDAAVDTVGARIPPPVEVPE